MLAAYVDLPELGVPRLGRFSPFLGGGAGAVQVEIGETRMAFPRTTTIVPGARRVNLAWMLTAGIATSLDYDTTLELAWRYTDLGPVETGEGRGRVVWRDGSREPGAAAARARPDAGEVEEPWSPPVSALRVLRPEARLAMKSPGVHDEWPYRLFCDKRSAGG